MTEEKTDVVKAEPPPLPILDNTTVLVKKPEDVAAAQETLLAWVEKQLAGLEHELSLAQENLDRATKMKVATGGWKRQVKIWQGRVTYYTKIKSAIEQGYFIMPDIPHVIDIFAVRTNQRDTNQISSGDHPWKPSIKDIEAKTLPEGEGRFVSPEPEVEEWVDNLRDKEGNDKKHYVMAATGINETIDFPLKVVRPQVLEEVDKAMLAKTFDQLGIITPGGRHRARRGDPIVVGRIIRRENGQERGCSFILHWWVDTRDI